MNSIVPAVDLLDGHVVRLYQGDYQQVTKYRRSPLEVARYFEDSGYTRLHLVDLLGAREGRITVRPLIEEISVQTTLKVDCSGGIRTFETAQECFDAGADSICIGSLAISNEEVSRKIIESFPHKVILGADCSGKNVRTHGWTITSDLNLEELLQKYVALPLYGVLVTDIQQDGTMEGANRELYKELLSKFPALRVIASGGVRSLEEAQEILNDGIFEVIVGKALYSKEGNDGC